VDQGNLICQEPFVLLLDKCCTQIAWPDAEKRLFEELKAMGLSPRLVVAHIKDLVPGGVPFPLDNDVSGCVLWLYQKNDTLVVGGWFLNEDSQNNIIVQRSRALKGLDPIIAGLWASETIRAWVYNKNNLQAPNRGEEPVDDSNIVHVSAEMNSKSVPRNPLPGIETGALVAWSKGGTGVKTGLAAAITVPLVDSLHIRVEAMALTIGAKIGVSDMSAELNFAAIRGWLVYQRLLMDGVDAWFGMGSGLLFTWATGFGGPDYNSGTDWGLGTYVGARVAFSIQLNKEIFLNVGFALGAPFPKTRVILAERVVGSLEFPMLDCSVLLGLKIF